MQQKLLYSDIYLNILQLLFSTLEKALDTPLCCEHYHRHYNNN